MKKIQFYASLLSMLTGYCAICAPIFSLVYWFNATDFGTFNPWLSMLAPDGWINNNQLISALASHPISVYQRCCAFGINGVWVALTSLQFYFLCVFFQRVSKGNVFCTTAIVALKRAATCILLWQFARPFIQIGTDAILSWHLPNASDHHYMALTLSTHNITQLLTACFLWIIATTLVHGHQLKQEQALTV